MRTRDGNEYEKVSVTFQLGGNIEDYFAWWLRVSATFTQRKFLWKEFPSCLRNQKRAKRTCWTVLRFCHVYVTFTGIPRGTFVISKNRVYLRKCTNPKTSVQHQVPYATWTIYDYSDPKGYEQPAGAYTVRHWKTKKTKQGITLFCLNLLGLKNAIKENNIYHVEMIIILHYSCPGPKWQKIAMA